MHALAPNGLDAEPIYVNGIRWENPRSKKKTVISDFQIRSLKREKLEKKLTEDRHVAEVAKRALGKIEDDIATKTIALEILAQSN